MPEEGTPKAEFYSSRAPEIQSKLAYSTVSYRQKKTPDQSGGKGGIRGKVGPIVTSDCDR